MPVRPSGREELRRLALRECTDGVWHGYLPGVGPGQLYGYRAHGPYQPEQGHRYNANKLLLDPYARKLAGALRWSDALYGYRLQLPARGSVVRSARQRRLRAQGAWSRRALRLGR